MSTPKLFQPITVGKSALKNRVVMAPMTRTRSTTAAVPHLPLVKEYYTQRAITPGTLLVSEGAFIAAKAGGIPHVPGLYTDEQLTAWKEITDSVHAAGSFIYVQLWALGRAAYEGVLTAAGDYPYVSASNIPLEGHENPPRPLTKEEIAEYVQMYATAAKNAIDKGGFDGVEVHGANGYLVDQFTQDVANTRTDEYGGSIENRARFALEVVDAIVEAVGAERTAIRLSPWGTFQQMRMKEPKPQFSYLVSQLKAKHPNMAYLSLVEPRAQGYEIVTPPEGEDNDFLREIWSPSPLMSAGGYSRQTALETAESKGDLIAFGRPFLANPDIVRRLKEDIPFNPYDRDTFYLLGDIAQGYTDYPFAPSN